ncbi:MAG: hypothetical protein K2I06_12145 [Ruminococcus sp.]|nr:hypothetical protein [Ruminococcus sp.]
MKKLISFLAGITMMISAITSISSLNVSAAYCFPPCTNYSGTSIVDGLKSIGVDSSKAYRTKIAEANGIYDYSGSASQNDYLLSLLKTGNLVDPDGTLPPAASWDCFQACTYNGTSIVDGLKSIGVDSSFDYRRRIAEANGIWDYSGTQSQNDTLLYLLKNGQLKNPDMVVVTTEPTTTATTTKATTTTTPTTTPTTTQTTTATTTVPIVTTTTAILNGVDNRIIVGEDNYSFLNKIQYFNVKYKISDQMKNNIGSLADNMDWEAISTRLDGTKKWEGSCYGMAAVQVLVKSGMLDVGTISQSASNLYGLEAPKNNQSVEDYINYYHVMQYTSVFRNKMGYFTRMSNKERVNEVIKLTEEVKNGAAPVLICFDYTKSPSSKKKMDGGHAVVGYGVEEGEWTYKDTTYNCRILISDSNVEGFADDNCLYINTDTYYWEIPYYTEKYYSCKNMNQNNNNSPYAQLRMVTNDLGLIDTYGYVTGNRNTSQTDEKISTISINSSSSDFSVIYHDDNDDSYGDINGTPDCDLIFYGNLLDSSSSENTVSAILPSSDHAYEYFERDLREFDTVIEYPDSRLSAKASNGSYAVYYPDKSVELNGENTDYTLSMALNEGYHSTKWYKLEVSGFNSGEAKLTAEKNGYVLSGDALSEGVMIKVSDRNGSEECNIITSEESILIYDAGGNNIGIKIDKDNNGSYETDFVPDYIGDVNFDSKVNIADMVIMEKYLLGKQEMTAKQFIASDMNGDGQSDSFDMVKFRNKLLNK